MLYVIHIVVEREESRVEWCIWQNRQGEAGTKWLFCHLPNRAETQRFSEYSTRQIYYEYLFYVVLRNTRNKTTTFL